SRFLSAGEITTSGLVAEVTQSRCIGCGDCEEVCPYKAIELVETTKDFEDVSIIIKKSSINSALCKGCGTCAATCPVGAISVKHYDFDQINAMIDSYLLEKVKNGGST
ncbi:MAG: 4Fe-4S binding protein, partial [Promethearchaeota archaeon]